MAYQENDEKQEFPDFDKVYKRFKDKGIVKAPQQRRMYEAIAKNWCIGKAVIDCGCGMGIGTNILGREALGAWGVDINEESVKSAKEMFENMKIKFEVVDLLSAPERPFATFDVVVCIEVIEHLKDFETLLTTLKRFGDERRKTVFFISSPNRNSEDLGQDRPNNEFHVREWTAGEFYEVLTKHFGAVVMYSGLKVDTFSQEETVDGNTKETPLLAKCEFPL
jgi:2-polyprenyl-3-methyl-5-hydroxy-6-metoxy-1,4-benzoquinol methylase